MRRTLSLIALLFVVSALPLAASQFIQQPFDQVAREASLVVRGTVENTWSAWDDSHEVIFTYATLRVSRYFGDTTGPDTLVVREVGGTVDGYTQEAIGFPEIRKGEDVVLMLAPWDGSPDLRIHAYNQGKYLVKRSGTQEILVEDMVRQGDARLERGHDHGPRTNAVEDVTGLGIDEFAQMVDDARAGRLIEKGKRQ
ncbi:MAG TPA: hypothetical protein VND45_09145 [Thermoanaerobaculia bacterium]|jgi:hypothetical protein|nr:hypothetical protein [Thermoanaerobaculia bacterium]